MMLAFYLSEEQKINNMLQFTKEYQNQNGGFLHAISKKSAQYLKQVLRNKGSLKKLPIDLKKLDRTISHTHPHLDEYFADLLFRSCLPDYKMDIDFMEMSVQSQEYDSTCEAYWPNAAVMGIGATLNHKPKSIYLFDEHVKNGKVKDLSCSQIVADQMLKKFLPFSVYTVLREVNEIDAAGGAHTQHIGNIIKTAHNVRFMFKKEKAYHNSLQNWLPPQWKKTIMDASIIAIIYCLENNIELWKNFKERANALKESMEYYFENCPYQKDPVFNQAVQFLRATYRNQSPSFLKAVLPISKNKGQLMLLGRVCYALEVCWGKDIAKIIMMNFWEVVYQGQAIFNDAILELKSLCSLHVDQSIHSKYGSFQRQTIKLRNIKSLDSYVKDLWIFYVEPTPMFVLGNRPLMYLLNQQNSAYGIAFFNDSFNFRKAIFRGKNVPYELWKRLIDHVCKLEPECWHKSYRYNTDIYAPFLINGNPAHGYVPQSQIDLKDLVYLISKSDN